MPRSEGAAQSVPGSPHLPLQELPALSQVSVGAGDQAGISVGCSAGIWDREEGRGCAQSGIHPREGREQPGWEVQEGQLCLPMWRVWTSELSS